MSCSNNIYNEQSNDFENGPMQSSRINVPVILQTLNPSDPNPSYIQFTTVNQSLYDYDNNGGAYSLTASTIVTINRTGYYSIGLLTNVNSTVVASPIFQVHNIAQGGIGSVPPILSIYCRTSSVSFSPGLFCTQSGFANAQLQAGTQIRVAYITDVVCNILPTSALSITLLDGVIGPAGSGGSGSTSLTNIGTGEIISIPNGSNYNIKSLSSNSPIVFVTATLDEIRFSVTPANSVGSGNSLVLNGFNQIKSLTDSGSITISDNGNTLDISSPIYSCQNVSTPGTAYDVYIDGSTPAFNFKRLKPGANTSISDSGFDLTINSTGVTSLSTSGSGIDLVFNSNGVIKSLLSGSSMLQISDNGPDITFLIIEPAPAPGLGISLIASSSDNLFNRLIAGSNVTLNQIGNDIEISATGSGGGSLSVTNMGVSGDGSAIISGAVPISSGTANFRRILGGRNLTTSTLTNSIRVDVDNQVRVDSVSVYRGSSVAIGSSYANIVFNSPISPGWRDPSSPYSTGSGNYTTISGAYQFSYNLIIDSSSASSGLVEAKLNVPGSTFDNLYTNVTIAGANSYTLNASGFIYPNVASVISVQVRYTGFESVFVNAGSAFSVWRLY